MTTLFKSFNRRSPADSDPNFTQMQGVRANLLALAASIAMGGALPGWSFTTSVTRGEASPGTSAQPARVYFSYPTDTKTIWVRAAVTYDGSGYPTKFAFSYSDDNEASYDNMDDVLNGYSFLNITYDGSHYVSSMTWGKS